MSLALLQLIKVNEQLGDLESAIGSAAGQLVGASESAATVNAEAMRAAAEMEAEASAVAAKAAAEAAAAATPAAAAAGPSGEQAAAIAEALGPALEQLAAAVGAIGQTVASEQERPIQVVNTLPKYYGRLYQHHIDVIERSLQPTLEAVGQHIGATESIGDHLKKLVRYLRQRIEQQADAPGFDVDGEDTSVLD
jgi:hypothetical protein